MGQHWSTLGYNISGPQLYTIYVQNGACSDTINLTILEDTACSLCNLSGYAAAIPVCPGDSMIYVDILVLEYFPQANNYLVSAANALGTLDTIYYGSDESHFATVGFPITDMPFNIYFTVGGDTCFYGGLIDSSFIQTSAQCDCDNAFMTTNILSWGGCGGPFDFITTISGIDSVQVIIDGVYSYTTTAGGTFSVPLDTASHTYEFFGYTNGTVCANDIITIPSESAPTSILNEPALSNIYTLCVGESLTLNAGSGWTMANWYDVTLGISDTTGQFNTVSYGSLGVYEYTLIAWDACGNATTYFFQINVQFCSTGCVGDTVMFPPDAIICLGDTIQLIVHGINIINVDWIPSSSSSFIATGLIYEDAPTATTLYTIVVTTSGGCVYTHLVTVEVINCGTGRSLNAGNDQTINLGSTVTLTGTTFGFSGTANYYWSDGVNIVGTGLSINVSPSTSTNYRLYGVDDTGYYIDHVTIYVDNVSSIENLFEEIMVEVFPNPTADVVNVFINESTVKDVAIRITDVNGNLVYEIVPQQSLTTIDVTRFNSGIYLITVYSDEGYSESKRISVIK